MAYHAQVAIPALGGLYVRNIDDCLPDQAFAEFDNSTNVALSAVSWAHLLCDSPIGDLKPHRLIDRFLRDLRHDIKTTIISFASLWDEIVSHSHVTPSDIPPELMAGCKRTPIFREILQYFRSGDGELFGFISTFLLFGKKLYFEDPTFHSTSLRGWIENEQRLNTVQPNKAVLQDLRAICSWILAEWEEEHFLPLHGGGSCSNSKPTIQSKERSHKLPAILHDVIVENKLHLRSVYDMFELGVDGFNDASRTSKLLFVPKDLRKSRTICMEPVSLQWFQQGIRLWLEKAIALGPMGRNIPLKDQSQNRALAQYGSLSSLVDTIDLSSASDLVHTDLVEAIFPPRIFQYLIASRSSHTDVGGVCSVKLTKFAPMGSALCFPVQSIIYSAVVALASIYWRHGNEISGSFSAAEVPYLYHTSVDSTSLRPKYGRLIACSIFGDDIITDHRITSSTITLLQDLGFIPNVEKSFIGDVPFRESCGGFYLNGKDVTPLRFKGIQALPNGSVDVVKSLSSLIELANLALDRGYYNLRSALIQLILHADFDGVYKTSSGINPILFSSHDDKDTSFSLRAQLPRNPHLLFDFEEGRRGSNSIRFQRIEVRSVAPAIANSETLSYDYEGYLHSAWWRGKTTEVPQLEAGLGISRLDDQKMAIKWRWTPA